QTVKESLDEVYTHLNGRFPKHDYNKIIQVLNHQKSKEQDRKEFERHFQQSQEGFYEQLRKKYPELTNNEMRLCSLLRMNMNTKEIADRLRISPKSAEVSRYRLRKKMELDSKVNLSKFLQEMIP
ncbi:MAG: LuxR C-terminal-related transcriptional regulator, partial [Bacteroidaceae bacterium]